MAHFQFRILLFAIFLVICGSYIVAGKSDGERQKSSSNQSLRQRLVPPAKVSSFLDNVAKSKKVPQKPLWWRTYRKQMRSKQPKLEKCDFLKGVIPMTGNRCTPMRGSDSFMCMFGEQQCESNEYSGKTHPTTKCECQSDGKWNCEAWNPCDNKDITTEIGETKISGRSYDVRSDVCPVDIPNVGQECSGKMACSYETERCCGEEHPSIM
jgi:hypothetical protein